MATNPYAFPSDLEFEDEDPELEARLDEQERLLERGELKLIPDSEVRAMLREMGVPISDDDPADPEAGR